MEASNVVACNGVACNVVACNVGIELVQLAWDDDDDEDEECDSNDCDGFCDCNCCGCCCGSGGGIISAEVSGTRGGGGSGGALLLDVTSKNGSTGSTEVSIVASLLFPSFEIFTLSSDISLCDDCDVSAKFDVDSSSEAVICAASVLVTDGDESVEIDDCDCD